MQNPYQKVSIKSNVKLFQPCTPTLNVGQYPGLPEEGISFSSYFIKHLQWYVGIPDNLLNAFMYSSKWVCILSTHFYPWICDWLWCINLLNTSGLVYFIDSLDCLYFQTNEVIGLILYNRPFILLFLVCCIHI